VTVVIEAFEYFHVGNEWERMTSSLNRIPVIIKSYGCCYAWA